MKKAIFLFLSALAITAIGCSEDESTTTAEPLEVAFVNQEINVSAATTQVNVVFSKTTATAGTIILNVEADGVTYGTDFITLPEATAGVLTLPVAPGVNSVSFSFTKLIEATEGQTKNVKFTIESITGMDAQFAATTNFTQLNFNEVPVLANIMTPNIGGNTFPNNVYVDLSSGVCAEIARASWEIGFYSGNEFRVVLNPSVNKLAVKQLATNNIDEVQASDANVTTGNYDPAGAGYIDQPSGNLSGTAIAEIATNDADNKVYLVNLGQSVSSTPATGSNVALTGTDRGWKKIRILRNGNGYKLQYANIDATTHNEISISKDLAHNFTFFSLVNGTVAIAEPLKSKWDINLGTFMNYTVYNGQDVSYYYSDFVASNVLAGTRIYQVLTSEFAYDSFVLANVDAAKFAIADASDRRAIGSNWRATYPSASVKTDRFYVIRDVAGNLYKMKFTAMMNGAAERGNITFEYVKL